MLAAAARLCPGPVLYTTDMELFVGPVLGVIEVFVVRAGEILVRVEEWERGAVAYVAVPFDATVAAVREKFGGPGAAVLVAGGKELPGTARVHHGMRLTQFRADRPLTPITLFMEAADLGRQL